MQEVLSIDPIDRRHIDKADRGEGEGCGICILPLHRKPTVALLRR